MVTVIENILIERNILIRNTGVDSDHSRMILVTAAHWRLVTVKTGSGGGEVMTAPAEETVEAVTVDVDITAAMSGAAVVTAELRRETLENVDKLFSRVLIELLRLLHLDKIE